MKMYRFLVIRQDGEAFKLLGQGETVSAAFKDGIENAQAPFRPKQDARKQTTTTVSVCRPDGSVYHTTLSDWEKQP